MFMLMEIIGYTVLKGTVLSETILNNNLSSG
jgi:hypothetical protein